MFLSFHASSNFCNLCKQFRPRSGPTECRSWSGSKPFGHSECVLERIFWKSWFWKDNKNMENYPTCKELYIVICFFWLMLRISVNSFFNHVRTFSWVEVRLKQGTFQSRQVKYSITQPLCSLSHCAQTVKYVHIHKQAYTNSVKNFTECLINWMYFGQLGSNKIS